MMAELDSVSSFVVLVVAVMVAVLSGVSGAGLSVASAQKERSRIKDAQRIVALLFPSWSFLLTPFILP